MDSFFGKILQDDFDIRAVSKGAFTQARAKLSPEVFVHINQTDGKEFYGSTEVHIWEGMRVLSVDSTRVSN